jgi:hypothetical protein
MNFASFPVCAFTPRAKIGMGPPGWLASVSPSAKVEARARNRGATASLPCNRKGAVASLAKVLIRFKRKRLGYSGKFGA